MATKRKIPERKCVVTGEMRPKKELIRIVRNKEGEVFVDPTGKKNGRGAYVTKTLEVIEKAEQSNILARTLNTEIESTIYEELRKLVSSES
ncbi:RNase P modulator RnpM [Oceanobacillus alkalisoli]|uniref:RNase P modulator RnpM n=1 Tax=Oceanobacillus alkalisoli TaxID=2925113 RepID=UPI001F122203|nr:YlxR family protein [Oceanobacillus alkalisoli]MCF3942395.1 YlxR family protein [Oceanobacillus alkalisoli]